jgi:N-methylhydantoinase A/oxoprolinase/acetone carboxylase beta subunit
MIEAIDVHTAGLGGDSELHLDVGGRPTLGPRRVVPLSLLAMQHPEVLGTLEEQAARQRPRERDGQLLLRRRLPHDPASLGPSARRLWELLGAGPATVERVVEREHLGIAMRRLVDRGLVVGTGFTPSDAAHLLGRQRGWSLEAARLGAILVARRLWPDTSPDVEALARLVLELAGVRTGELLLEAALSAEGEPATEILAGPARGLVARALGAEASPLVRARLELTVPVVAVGGPAAIFYPVPTERLGTRLVVPPHHATGNAIGAVVGRVERRATVLVSGDKATAWRVHLPEGPVDLAELAAALDRAEAAARAAAVAGARAAGAADPLVSVERRERAYADTTGARRVLEVEIVATATGRPAFAAAAG